jgi:hypothetical protein
MKDNNLNIGTLVKAGSLGLGIITGEAETDSFVMMDGQHRIGEEVKSSQLVYIFKLQRAIYIFVEHIKPMTVESRAC